MRHLTLDEQDGDDGADNLSMDGEHDDGYEGLPGNTRTGPSSRSRQATAPHSPVNPTFPKSDADARTQLLDRKEQDAQERLDLEEEKRERLLAEGPAAMGAGAQTGGMGGSVLEGEYLVLLLSARSSAAGSSFFFSCSILLTCARQPPLPETVGRSADRDHIIFFTPIHPFILFNHVRSYLLGVEVAVSHERGTMEVRRGQMLEKSSAGLRLAVVGIIRVEKRGLLPRPLSPSLQFSTHSF